MTRKSTHMDSNCPSRRGILCLLLLSLFYDVSGDCMAVINHGFQHECLRPRICSSNWTALTISDDTYEKLASDFFHSCSALTELMLKRVKLNKLSESTLQGLSSLEVLTMSEVPLYSFSAAVLKHTPSLRSLTVSRAKTMQLTFESFKPCGVLRKLKFDKTPLNYLEPNAFSDCGASLTTLTIRSGKLSDINPESFSRLTSLRLLDLTDNQIVAIGSRTFSDLSDLRNLILRKNIISSIDIDAFQGLSALTTLDLSGNRITELNVDMLKKMPYLKRLKLKDNRIVHLAPNFSWLKKRLTISLDKNRLLCRPQMKHRMSNRLTLTGIPEDLPYCVDTVVTAKPAAAQVIEKSPKHQRFSANQGKDLKSRGVLEVTGKPPMMIFVTPPWIFAWAISMTIAFVIAACTLIFIFINRRREIKRHQKKGTGQAVPLNDHTAT